MPVPVGPHDHSINDLPVGWGPGKIPASGQLDSPDGASHVGYDPTTSGIPANNVQDAIDFLSIAPPGTGAVLARVPFTFASGVVVLAPLALGELVSPCYVRITAPWNLPGATLTIGTPSQPGALLAANDVDLYRTSRYDAGLDLKTLVAENLLLTIAGPSTLGAGYVVFLRS